MRGAGDCGCRYLPVSCASCRSMLLWWLCPRTCLCCWKGNVMPYKKGRAGLSSKKTAFPSNLSPLGVCSAVLEVPGSRLVSDCAYTITSGWVLSTLRLRPLCYPPHLHAGFGFAAGLQRTRRRSGQGLAQSRLWLSCSDASWPVPAFPWAQMSEGQQTKLNSI